MTVCGGGGGAGRGGRRLLFDEPRRPLVGLVDATGVGRSLSVDGAAATAAAAAAAACKHTNSSATALIHASM